MLSDSHSPESSFGSGQPKAYRKAKRYCTSGTSRTSYLSLKIAENVAAKDGLAVACSELQERRDYLQTRELMCRLGINLADEHLRLALARACVFPAAVSRLHHRMDQYQVRNQTGVI